MKTHKRSTDAAKAEEVPDSLAQVSDHIEYAVICAEEHARQPAEEAHLFPQRFNSRVCIGNALGYPSWGLIELQTKSNAACGQSLVCCSKQVFCHTTCRAHSTDYSITPLEAAQ